MAAAVSPPAPLLQNDLPTATAIARKRRREIVQSQRAGAAEAAAAPVPTETEDSLPPKKRKISKAPKFPGKESRLPNNGNGAASIAEISHTKTPPDATKNKKPQMKYDPDVPMTKEETAVWRREQRRKRNRESAAASRQRQRDRIEELEAEVEDWKAKFASVMERLNKLEEEKSTQTPSNAGDIVLGCGSDATSPEQKSLVSPSSPDITPQLSPDALPVPSSLVDTRRDQVVVNQKLHRQQTEETSEQHLIETISRPAVKITGAAPSQVLSAADPAPGSPRPDPCVSSMEMLMTPITTEMVPTPVSPSSSLEGLDCVAAVEDVGELEEFLLDAVDWL